MFALEQRGKPYVWGAAGPGAYDCSGLTLSAWAHGGVAITRTTYTQRNDGTATDESSLRPGDLVLIPGSDGSLASPGHLGMFIGEGLIIHAPHTGDVVNVVTFKSFTAGGISALRHIGGAASGPMVTHPRRSPERARERPAHAKGNPMVLPSGGHQPQHQRPARHCGA